NTQPVVGTRRDIALTQQPPQSDRAVPAPSGTNSDPGDVVSAARGGGLGAAAAPGPVVRGGGAPPRLDPSTGPRGGDGVADGAGRGGAGVGGWFVAEEPGGGEGGGVGREGGRGGVGGTVVARGRVGKPAGRVNAHQGLVRYYLRPIGFAPNRFVQDYTLRAYLK